MVLLVCWASSSYSEPYTYGTTNNAAGGGLTWDMSRVLPDAPGLSVNSVIYRYTPVKEVADYMLVHVQNEKADGSGLLFRETDDWTGRPGVPINKLVSVNNIPISEWGRGSIQVEGVGTVKDASVVYTYKIDQCYDPQSDPTCPGYVTPMPDIPPVELYSAIDDEAVKGALKATETEKYKKEKQQQQEERALKESKDAESIAQDNLLQAMNNATNFTAYYSLALAGGVYKETVQLVDKKIPENRKGLRNGLAQQLLHTKMVDLQYKGTEQ